MPDPKPDPCPDLTGDQIAIWADRIADGRDEFPADLSEPDRSALADAVRRGLRDRLVRYIARAVASRLAAERDPSSRS
jgi:hypothetical protein